MVRPRNLLDIRSQAIVAAAEPELFGALAELTCESISATSLHGTRTRPPPPNQAAIRPSTPARPRQTPGPQRIATTSSASPGPPSSARSSTFPQRRPSEWRADDRRR